MDSAKLQARRQAVIDKHKLHESVDESPLSAKHPNMREMDGTPKVLHSERPVAIQIDDRVHLCGPCVGKVKAACAAWDAANPPADGEEGIRKFARKCAKRLAGMTGDVLDLGTQEFNGVLYAVGEQGVLVVLTSLEG